MEKNNSTWVSWGLRTLLVGTIIWILSQQADLIRDQKQITRELSEMSKIVAVSAESVRNLSTFMSQESVKLLTLQQDAQIRGTRVAVLESILPGIKEELARLNKSIDRLSEQLFVAPKSGRSETRP